GFLVREVPVHRGPADADGRAQIVEARAEEAAIGDEPRAGIEQLPPALGSLLFTARERAGFRAGPRRSSQPVWTTRLVKINLYSSYQRLTDRQDGVMTMTQDPRASAAVSDNYAAHQALVADLRARLATTALGGPEKARQRHIARG